MLIARFVCFGVVTATVLGGCAPTLDWREVRLDGERLVMLFPCKPERHSRRVPMAGGEATVDVLGCSADGTTWGLTTADVGDLSRVALALEELRSARSRNLDGRERQLRPVKLQGMKPAGIALRFEVSGQRPDGKAVAEQSAVFSSATRVFHAAALGGTPSQDALETFFGGLRLRP